jgi:hypothetical protein
MAVTFLGSFVRSSPGKRCSTQQTELVNPFPAYSYDLMAVHHQKEAFFATAIGFGCEFDDGVERHVQMRDGSDR